MKRRVATLALAQSCAFFLCATACTAGAVVKENREVGAFQKISAKSGVDVYFTQSASRSVVVEAEEEHIGKVVTEVDGETLVVKVKVKDKVFRTKSPLKVHVSAPALSAVEASGGADFHADSLTCESSFQLSVSGGADANIAHLKVGKDVAIASSGGADAKVRNLIVAGNTELAASGGADCDVEHLQTVSGKLLASGGADVDVKSFAAENLSLAASGGADISASGEAANLQASASGGADISVSGKATNVQASASSGADINIKNLTYTSINTEKSSGGDIHR
ncbi:MAG: DUF2807 domain-containing protein [Prevotellaceae bacterium]|jgi:hypothetical protein|nr:DUF2807 domain-containing protein [Prevotellaceae bacterium]